MADSAFLAGVCPTCGLSFEDRRMARPLMLSPSYLAIVRGVCSLHRLIAEGKEDSPEADAIRDASDGLWKALSETERDRARWFSEDLYSIHEAPPASPQMTREAQSGLSAVYEAKQKGEWDKALALLRKWRAYIDPALVSYLRGSIWYAAGARAIAALFFQHARELDPGDARKLDSGGLSMPTDSRPKCHFCGQVAVCHGTYEGHVGYACGDCCAHGCEDGWCEPVPVRSASAAREAGDPLDALKAFAAAGAGAHYFKNADADAMRVCASEIERLRRANADLRHAIEEQFLLQYGQAPKCVEKAINNLLKMRADRIELDAEIARDGGCT